MMLVYYQLWELVKWKIVKWHEENDTNPQHSSSIEQALGDELYKNVVIDRTAK